jgi:hypothetical protein
MPCQKLKIRKTLIDSPKRYFTIQEHGRRKGFKSSPLSFPAINQPFLDSYSEVVANLK